MAYFYDLAKNFRVDLLVDPMPNLFYKEPYDFEYIM